MDEGVKEYLENVSKMLNGQLRGAINLKAREENLVFVQLTMSDIWDKAVEYTRSQINDEQTLAKLKDALNDTDGPKT